MATDHRVHVCIKYYDVMVGIVASSSLGSPLSLSLSLAWQVVVGQTWTPSSLTQVSTGVISPWQAIVDIEATVVGMPVQRAAHVISAFVSAMANLVDSSIRHVVGMNCTCVINSNRAPGIKPLEMVKLFLSIPRQ